MLGFITKFCLLSVVYENRMNNNNDKMCLFCLEYHCVKTIFDTKKISFYILLTPKLRKLEYQQELVILLVQAVNHNFSFLFFLLKSGENRKVDLKLKIARFIFKELGEVKHHLWSIAN